MEGSILGDNYASGQKRVRYTRQEAQLALKLAQEGKAIPEIAKELNASDVVPKERSVNSVQYLVRTVLAPMKNMEQFDKRFPEGGESDVEDFD